MQYSITVTPPAKLSEDELVEAMESVHHISKRWLREHFPTSQIVCLLRCECCEGVIGVGVVKSPNEARASRVAGQASYTFPPDCCELGYVTIHHRQRGKGLANVIVDWLVHAYDGSLFATTSDMKMKMTLFKYGFQQVGNEWKGKLDQTLSLWIKQI